MEFAWSTTQNELYERVLAFSRTLDGHRIHGEDPLHFPMSQWKRCAQFGLMGLCVPEEYGGMGLDCLTTARAMEAFGHGCLDTGFVFSVAAHLFACAMPIVEHGDDSLKERILPSLCDGRQIAANAITEAEAGSDVFALKCRAEKIDRGYTLTGTKNYVSNAPIANIMVVYASTNPSHGHMGISAFVVERDRDGLSVGSPFGKIGLNTSPTSAVYFDQCAVPAENMIGREGTGARIFADSMGWERTCLFAAYVGVMDRQITEAVAFARERRQYGKRLAKYQAITHKIADMKLRSESARLLLYRACWLMDQGKDASMAIPMAKVAISEAAVQCGIDAIQIHGGMGIAAEANVERTLRDAIPSTIFSGTSEIQRNLIARALGL